MNTAYEIRSDIKPSSVWNSARIKSQEKLWNFQKKSDRSPVPDYGAKIVNRGKGVYQYGPYRGALDDIKGFAKIKGIEFLNMGIVKIKTA